MPRARPACGLAEQGCLSDPPRPQRLAADRLQHTSAEPLPAHPPGRRSLRGRQRQRQRRRRAHRPRRPPGPRSQQRRRVADPDAEPAGLCGPGSGALLLRPTRLPQRRPLPGQRDLGLRSQHTHNGSARAATLHDDSTRSAAVGSAARESAHERAGQAARGRRAGCAHFALQRRQEHRLDRELAWPGEAVPRQLAPAAEHAALQTHRL